MSAYDPSIPAVPAIAAAARDLDDRECAELDELLSRIPVPFSPMGVVALDGFLCGVLVQPVRIAPEEWLPYVFDTDARRLPTELASDIGVDRATELILRRHRALARALAEDGAFDPLIEDVSADGAAAGTDGEEAAGDPAAAGETAVEGAADGGPDVPAASRPLVEWAAGFHFATVVFPALEELDDDAVGLALVRIFRHLPAQDEAHRELTATLDAEMPLGGVDEAIDDLVAAVADIDDLTRGLRFHVDTVRRDTPKVGRNDPCPCGSGRKYKRCHGGGAA